MGDDWRDDLERSSHLAFIRLSGRQKEAVAWKADQEVALWLERGDIVPGQEDDLRTDMKAYFARTENLDAIVAEHAQYLAGPHKGEPRPVRPR